MCAFWADFVAWTTIRGVPMKVSLNARFKVGNTYLKEDLPQLDAQGHAYECQTCLLVAGFRHLLPDTESFLQLRQAVPVRHR